jgi:hypothetical protein
VNCILYLVDTYDLDNFRKSLDSIPALLRKYPIVAYYEDSLPLETRVQLKWQHPQLEFFPVSLERPHYPGEIEARIHDNFVMDICSFSLGYRSMCRFFSGEVFNRPELLQYEYVLRLDTDSVIINLPFDPFDVMVAIEADYGYRLLCNDHPQCYVDYYKCFKSVVEGLGHTYSFPENRRGWVYFTNFEVMRLSAFRSPLHQKVYDGLEKTGGFYVHRWGDHIHRYAYAQQFGLKTQQMVFGYEHGGSVFTNERELFSFDGPKD